MHSEHDRTSEGYREPKQVGFGRLAYDPINGTFWYYGYGKAVEQGGIYPGPTNFGCADLGAFLHMLKDSLEYAQPAIKRLTQEKVDERK